MTRSETASQPAGISAKADRAPLHNRVASGKSLPFVLLSVVLAAAAGCRSSSPSPSPSPAVPVLGSSSARTQLAGRWEGDYHSAATGRSGTIVFEFSKGPVGHGDVLMMPAASSEPLHPAHAAQTDETLWQMQVLTIQFVETSEGALTGTLEPYIDPGCACEVQTSFNGRILGDRISGSFTSRAAVAGTAETTGEWSVQRH